MLWPIYSVYDVVNEQTSHAIQPGMSVTQSLSIFQICRRDPAQESSASASRERAIVCDLWAVEWVCCQECRVQETKIMSLVKLGRPV